jgi:uncharacterized protein YciI
MGFFILEYAVVPDYAERRVPLRADHLRYGEAARARGELLLGGAYTDARGGPIDGALLVFTTDDLGVVERFAEGDPYVIAGLVTHWRVRAWNVAIGNRT